MAKHPNFKMLNAKINNMDLVIFSWNFSSDGNENSGGKRWWKSDPDFLPKDPREGHYFACLPQHEEACLWWLNGGDVERKVYGNWCSNTNLKLSCETVWDLYHAFMLETNEFRIVPPATEEAENNELLWPVPDL